MAEIRIISGSYKNRRIKVPDVEGLRPSPERLREMLFNCLQWEIQNLRVLDAFAGSGALGLEALSRGARSVMFIEKERAQLKQIQHLAQTWGAENAQFACMDALKHQAQYDLIMLDPPFSSNVLETAVAHFLPQLSASGYLYWEHHQALQPEGLRLMKSGRAGAVHYGLGQKI